MTDNFEATVCWFHERPLVAGDRLQAQAHHAGHAGGGRAGRRHLRRQRALELQDASELEENDIGVVRLRTATPLALDTYQVDRITGSFVLIDELTIATVAAGMVGRPALQSLRRPNR